jgi:hypothetical protein
MFWMSLLTVLVVFFLFAVLVIQLVRIIGALEQIGGTPLSALAKIRWGLRAIEVHTSHLEPELERLNGGLSAVDDGLAGIHGSLYGVVHGLERQKRRT